MKLHLLRSDSDVASLLSFPSSISPSVNSKRTSDTEAFYAWINTPRFSHHYCRFAFFFLGPHNMAPVFLGAKDSRKGTFQLTSCAVFCQSTR